VRTRPDTTTSPGSATGPGATTGSSGATRLHLVGSSYVEHTGWRRYQPHLPERHRLGEQNLPREQTWAWNGLQVHLDRYETPNPPAVIVGLHGGGGYGRMLAPIGLLARRLGLEAVLPDMPGYGLTPVPRRRFTYDTWVACARELIAVEHERTGRPVIALGGSMGGMLAWHTAAADAPLAAIVATTLLDTRDPHVLRELGRTPWEIPLALRLLNLAPTLTDLLPIPMAYVPNMTAIANNPAVVSIIRHDPLGGARIVPARFLRTWIDYQAQRDPHTNTLPVLLAHPGEDHWTPTALSQRFYDKLAGPKQLITLENCGHYPLEEPGLAQLETAVQEFVTETID
jgi:alpha-beta hydrolase superfamily lysophospholipase